MTRSTTTQIVPQPTKVAQTEHDILDVLKQRFSTRAFSPRPIERTVILRLFEAARWQASSRNAQPWRFIVATRQGDPDTYDKIFSILKEGNQSWAGNAPLLVLAVAETENDEGRVNRHATHDVGMALANLTTQATAEGLFLRMMGGFYPDKAREVFGIPDNYEAITALAIGYYGNPDDLDNERHRTGESSRRTRKPLSDILYGGTWGESNHLTSS